MRYQLLYRLCHGVFGQPPVNDGFGCYVYGAVIVASVKMKHLNEYGSG
ncbi:MULTISPECIES: hypothetical protein [unclassified Polynucleobacter]|nr:MULTISPECIES: hypothetical protein [unclassified Polynucleobacter]